MKPEARDAEPGADLQMPLGAHLTELRRRLIISLAAVLIGMMAAFPTAPIIIGWLQHPLDQPLYFLVPTEAFWAHLKVALFGGVVMALPVVFYQLWRFVAPGLYRTERHYALLFVAAATGFFLVGLAFSHLVAFPFALRFLVDFGLSSGLHPLFSVGAYLDFAVKFYFAFSIIFELPLLLTLSARLGVITAATLARYRRHALVINAVAAAILTPTADLFNMMVMLVPLTLLYEVGILGARLFGRRAVAVEASAER